MHGMTTVAWLVAQVHEGAADYLYWGFDELADVQFAGMPASAGDRPWHRRGVGQGEHHCQGDLLGARVAGQPPHHDAVFFSGELAQSLLL